MSIIEHPPYSATFGSGSGEGYTAGTGTAQPIGLESVLEYNTLRINDRSVYDTIRLTSIDGLGDADVRDSRVAYPGEHGEIASEALYGGRTITLTGRLEAGNISKLRDLAQALRSAFVDLQELPLTFIAPNPANNIQIYCRKVGPISIKEEQTNAQYWRNFQVTLRDRKSVV